MNERWPEPNDKNPSRHYTYNFNVFVMLGDGEMQEGQVWEAALFAAQNKLEATFAPYLAAR